MSRFAEGADGITTFNRFNPTHQLWWELGDPDVLRDLDKTYTCPHYLPATVTKKGCDPLRLLVGEDVRSAPPKGKRRSLNLRVHVTGLTAARGLEVKLNGQKLEPTKKWGSSPSPALASPEEGGGDRRQRHQSDDSTWDAGIGEGGGVRAS